MNEIDDNKLQLGIWLHNSSPQMIGEGISRLLAFIIKNSEHKNDVEITIVCLSWMKDPILKFLKQMNINTNNVKIVVSSYNIPYIYRLRLLREKKKKKKRKKYYNNKIYNSLKKIKKKIISNISGTNSILGVAIKTIIAIPILILIAIIILFAVAYRLFLKMPIISKIKVSIAKIKNKIHNKTELIARNLYSAMIDTEFERLYLKAKRLNNIDVWFLPYPNNKYIKYFNVPVVSAVPDLVYLDFPIEFLEVFGKEMLSNIHNNIKDTIKYASATISYSDYVAENHAKKLFKGDASLVKVVHHANVETINELKKMHDRTGLDYTTLSTRIIKNYIKHKTRNKATLEEKYLSGISWENIEYIFISSQVRPHKNYLNIFKAFEKVLRQDYRNIKLVITGNPGGMVEVAEFIKNRKLQYDILPITALPPKVHAAFYQRAALTVVPTLFEGGFPFCFSESLSVNTPVIMSDIPVTAEVIQDEKLRKEMLFDPYNVDDIRKKMIWALDNKEELDTSQIKLYEELKKRTWDDVADEYIQCFREVKELYGKNKIKEA